MIERYHHLHGYYPDDVLADKLYRNRENIALAKAHGIKIIGPKLGRKPKYIDQEERREANAAARDAENRRGKIERHFSFIKHKCGLGLVRAKTAATIAVLIDLGIMMANIETVLRFFSWKLLLTTKTNDVYLKISYQTNQID